MYEKYVADPNLTFEEMCDLQMKFENSEDSPHNLARQKTAPEPLKWQITLRFLPKSCFVFFPPINEILK